jgi:cysteinyl-tRNA synthetase
MSKSLGNIETISKVLEKYNGQVIRLALLSSHYKQPLDWSDSLLKQSKATLEKWYELYDDAEIEADNGEMFSCLLDDLNTPKYFAKLHELYNIASKGDKTKKVMFNDACRLIGIFNQKKVVLDKQKQDASSIDKKYILQKIEERIKARKTGNFKLADKIRDELSENGIEIKDNNNRTDWEYK